MASMNGKVFFLGVARAQDKVLVASTSYNNMKIDLGAVKKMLVNDVDIKAMGRELHMFTTAVQDPNNPKAGLLSKSGDGFAWSVIVIGSCIYMAATVVDYPAHVSKNFLEDTARLFAARVSDQWRASKEGGLTENCKVLFESQCVKYDNLTEFDKAGTVLKQVEAVKKQMEANIAQALSNTSRAEEITASSNELEAQAGMFKKQATTLKDIEWWKDMKPTLWIAFVVFIAVGTFVIVLLAYTGYFDKTDGDDTAAVETRSPVRAPARAPTRSPTGLPV